MHPTCRIRWLFVSVIDGSQFSIYLRKILKFHMRNSMTHIHAFILYSCLLFLTPDITFDKACWRNFLSLQYRMNKLLMRDVTTWENSDPFTFHYRYLLTFILGGCSCVAAHVSYMQNTMTICLCCWYINVGRDVISLPQGNMIVILVWCGVANVTTSLLNIMSL